MSLRKRVSCVGLLAITVRVCQERGNLKTAYVSMLYSMRPYISMYSRAPVSSDSLFAVYRGPNKMKIRIRNKSFISF
jgi:hypothetical protein